VSAYAILVTFEACALLLIGLGIPLWRRKVRPNRLYGYRVPATLRDERVWYEVNAGTGADLIGVGAVLALLAPALFYGLGQPAEIVTLGCCAWMSAGVLFATVHGALRIRELARGR
jgi:hypothetical protein